MNARYRIACETLSQEIRARWHALLVSDPAWSSNLPSQLLASLQENVLEELWSTLRRFSHASGPPPGNLIAFPEWPQGACRMGPLLVFLGRGRTVLEQFAPVIEQGLCDIPKDELERQRAELLRAFDLVTRREIEGICSYCPDGMGCPLCTHQPAQGACGV